MTMNIDPLALGAAATPPATPVSASVGPGDFAATLGAARAGNPSAEPEISAASGPPAAVREEMAAASRTWDSLAANGQELRFREDPAGGRVHVALHHVSGERIAVLDLGDVYTLIEHERRA